MTTTAAPARRLPPPRHGDDALLDLVAEVAREAARRGDAVPAEAVSVRAFNRLRADVDRTRGVDPDGPDRIPTAHAVIGHFKARTTRAFAWGGCRRRRTGAPAKRQQWLVSSPALGARHLADRRACRVRAAARRR